MVTILEMREERAKLVSQMGQIISKCKSEDRDLTGEENAEWSKMEQAESALKAKIDFAEKEERASRLQTEINRPVQTVAPYKPSAKRSFNAGNVFRAWALYRSERATPSAWLEDAANAGINLASPQLSLRALSKGSNSAGGYDTQAEPMIDIEKVLLWYGPMLNVVRTVNTDTGSSLPWPTVDSTSLTASVKSEAASIATNTADPTFGQVSFSAYKYSTGNCLVSLELLQDAVFPIEEILAESLGEQLGRTLNTDMTVGDGSSKITGIAAASGGAAEGIDIAAATLSWTHVLDLIHSVDPAYRNRAKCKLMMNDSTLKYLKKLVDDESRPIYTSVALGEPPTFDGFDHTINNDVVAMGTDTKSIFFGDFSKFILRRAGDIIFYRLDELYAGNMQVGFGAHIRADGKLVNSAAVKYLQC